MRSVTVSTHKAEVSAAAGLGFVMTVAVLAGACAWCTGTLIRQKAELLMAERSAIQLERQVAAMAANLTVSITEAGGRLQTLASAQPGILVRVREQNAGYSSSPERVRAEMQRRDQVWSESDSLLRRLLGGVAAAKSSSAGLWGGMDRHLTAGEALLVTDRVGGTVAATRWLPRFSWAGEPWWKLAMENCTLAIGTAGFTRDESQPRPLLVIALPVTDPTSGMSVGVVANFLDVSLFFAPDRPGAFGERVRAWLAARGGTVLFDSQAWALAPGRVRNSAALPPYFLRETKGRGRLTEPGGREWRCGFSRVCSPEAVAAVHAALPEAQCRVLQDWGLTLVLGEEEGDTARQDLYALRKIALVGAVAGGFLTGLLALLCWGQMVSKAQTIVAHGSAATRWPAEPLR